MLIVFLFLSYSFSFSFCLRFFPSLFFSSLSQDGHLVSHVELFENESFWDDVAASSYLFDNPALTRSFSSSSSSTTLPISSDIHSTTTTSSSSSNPSSSSSSISSLSLHHPISLTPDTLQLYHPHIFGLRTRKFVEIRKPLSTYN